ncbi:ubiquinol-cytochrome c reductase subunit 6 [Sporothrix brasiliensis 5110]|uniref:Ubiquinol-cytochrome c reductase subunit 6 n=1 Tax=Sporothrix brasiliensis 5110 TaxID=1398154 RepID=A0A0C2J5L2_9PEZI|nr:ubiquinol-cytochrome c reductase subunit 6 [Sporothrix brasiliensis 5110]KIH92347.1 ubiquinol-cytochrome c reductase subunit 6 [Sporothrix brasiliensis 5110]
MGVWDTITDLIEAAAPWSVAEAEAAANDAEAEAPEENDAKAEDEAEDEEDGEEEEEDEEDEDEVVDPKDQLEEDCRNSKECAPAKHHFEECVERVENGSKEDCVEECK